MITKVALTSKDAEQVFEEEVVAPIQKRRFTIRQLDTEISHLQARLDSLTAKKTEALGIKEEVVNDGI